MYPFCLHSPALRVSPFYQSVRVSILSVQSYPSMCPLRVILYNLAVCVSILSIQSCRLCIHLVYTILPSVYPSCLYNLAVCVSILSIQSCRLCIHLVYTIPPSMYPSCPYNLAIRVSILSVQTCYPCIQFVSHLSLSGWFTVSHCSANPLHNCRSLLPLFAFQRFRFLCQMRRIN